VASLRFQRCSHPFYASASSKLQVVAWTTTISQKKTHPEFFQRLVDLELHPENKQRRGHSDRSSRAHCAEKAHCCCGEKEKMQKLRVVSFEKQ